MGWTTMHETRTAKQFFTDMFKKEELVDIAIKNFTVAYVALRCPENGYVFCQTFLLHRAPKSYENFGYKPVSEFMGPVTTECPKRILDKLTPIEEIAKHDKDLSERSLEWAKEWREKCYENIKNSKKLKNAIIKTNEPVKFTSGAEYQYFKRKGRKWFAIANYGTKAEMLVPVRITGWRNTPYTFV